MKRNTDKREREKVAGNDFFFFFLTERYWGRYE